MATTLLLDQTTWDLCLDAYGNIALASDPYSLAQDVASAVRTFQGECWFNTADGVPYFSEVLGQSPPLQLLQSLIEQAALTVNEVVKASATITSFKGRTIKGTIQVTTSSGITLPVTF
jgi:hypothetical protein